MKNLSITAILIAFTLFACKPKTNPVDEVKSVRFKFTELGRETQFRITCDKFDYYFPEGKVKNFIQKASVDSVMLLLTDMKRTDDGFQPDVRGKIYINHPNNAVDTLCVGVKVLTYKSATYETPQSLLALIQK
ncbi:hypothetical protein SAMN05421821_1192 [Mucilaginibacter lappiensis]|uniref:Lipoprotein n=1 Tax=Mucilaginibacter lappiensis TaxID=354630 RepID=A0ABR6PSB3_9SPHI|nr:hypothetical protein [Mucilaginibacter lappiensis]MBB6112468.1 hypothetical protein [Mucilaginibacter lappiensis]SIS02092.1 hypothetical protein SAMN05421821_1192 [Mucilaginibacter lappiensis]